MLVMALGLCPGAMIAHENYRFTHLKSDAGLPHLQVESMAFDHDGMLWVGTRNGLAKYDGYSFITYYHNSSDLTSIPHNFISKVFVDSNNDVWIGTDMGICLYQRETDDFKRFNLKNPIRRIVETNDGSIVCAGMMVYIMKKGERSFGYMPRTMEDYVEGLAVSPDNRIFISTDNSISYYSPDMMSKIPLDSSVYSDFLNGHSAIVPLFFDHNGLLWIGRDGKGVMSLDLESGEKRIYDASMLTDGTSRVITEDSQGCIWIGTESGVTVIDPSTGVIDKITGEFCRSRTLSDNAIYCITPDAQDNMWIGTYFGGINTMHRNTLDFEWIAPGYSDKSLHGKVVRRISEPEPGVLWLATEDGGISIYDVRSKQIEKFERIPELGANVHELYYDKTTDDMWIGTFRNGLFRYNMRSGKYEHYTAFNSRLNSDLVFAVAGRQDDDGKVWIGTVSGLDCYDPEAGCITPVNHGILGRDFIYCLYFDKMGNLWAGTVNNGLFRIDVTTGDIINFRRNSVSAKDGLGDNYITSLWEDSSGRMFVGTNSNGVYIVDTSSLELSKFPESSALWGTICSVMQDNTGNVWITTSSGMYKVNPDDLSFVKFTIDDGLPENQFNFSSILQASNNRLYCGTVNGLVSFDPSLTKRLLPAASVHLWGLTLNNEPVNPGSADSPLETTLDVASAIELDYSSSRMFSIDYGIVAPAGAENVRYSIFVEGLDKSWRDVGAQRRFTAMGIPPGHYTFKVRALVPGDDLAMVPVKELDIKISAPFFRSTAAYIMYAVLGLLLCYVAYRLFIWRMKSKHRENLNRIEREKSDELNRVKMEFFTNISHELKTPLSLIIAPLKYLSANEKLSNESRDRLSVAMDNTSKMVDLINELVTFNRVESGNMQLFLQKGNPLTLIETMTGYFRGPASDKKITINVMTQDNGEDVWFSAIYLDRIIGNLLSNAIKYTDEGGNIDVRASIIEGDDNEVFLQFEVKDTGIGIAPEEIDNIFKKYYQTKPGYSMGRSGWGIGLATVKKLVEMHKGSISVVSKEGEGSSFTVRLNVAPEAFDSSCRLSPGMEQYKIEQPPFLSNTFTEYNENNDCQSIVNDADKVSILIVEDNQQLLRFLATEFSKNYNVYTATNGVDALKVTADYSVDIVVSDVMMPEMDGIELCERLKNDLATSHIPVILLTARSDESSTIAGFQSGAEAYVAKPFDPQLLMLRVKNILRVRQAYIKSRICDNTESDESEPVEELPSLNKFDNEFMTRINKLIEDNMDNSELSIADITQELGISRSLLHIKMKTFFNMSMTDYIKKCRMTMACELFKKGYNVGETAYRAGYSDPNYFSKVFKRTFGISPSDYISSLSSSEKD